MLVADIKEIKRVIEDSKDIRAAAQQLGVSHNTLYYNLRKHNLKVVKRLKVIKAQEPVAPQDAE